MMSESTEQSTQEDSAEKAKVPFVVIGGYLGAGKTTLLNRVLANTQGLRAVVMVNDFGSVNIDADLIAQQDAETISLTNGCICCTLASGFLEAIKKIQEMDPAPDAVIVEASGIANPARVASYGHYPGFSWQGTVVLADAETVRERATNAVVGDSVLRGLRFADLIVMTKTDLVDDETANEVEAWLREQAPSASIIRSRTQDLPLSALLGLAGGERPFVSVDERDHAVHEMVTLQGDVTVDRAVLEDVLNTLPNEVIRAKGIVRLKDSPETRSVFQLVGKRWEITSRGIWTEGESSRLVFIGFPGSIDREELRARFPGMTQV